MHTISPNTYPMQVIFWTPCTRRYNVNDIYGEVFYKNSICWRASFPFTIVLSTLWHIQKEGRHIIPTSYKYRIRHNLYIVEKCFTKYCKCWRTSFPFTIAVSILFQFQKGDWHIIPTLYKLSNLGYKCRASVKMCSTKIINAHGRLFCSKSFQHRYNFRRARVCQYTACTS